MFSTAPEAAPADCRHAKYRNLKDEYTVPEPSLEQLYEVISTLVSTVGRDRRLNDPRAESVTVRSPICGSQLTLEAVIVNDRVEQLGWKVRSCALGQATTAIVIQHQDQLDAARVARVGSQLRALLKGEITHCDWPELDVFAAAREISSRHESALLPFTALGALFERAQSRYEACGQTTDGRKYPEESAP